jgi:hypothetical protein
MKIVIGGLLGSVIGSIVGAWCVTYFPRRALKRQLTINLYERFTSPNFYIVRAEVGILRRAWNQGDHFIINFFLPPYYVTVLKQNPKYQVKAANGLTLPQNLAYFMSFFSQLVHYHEARLLNTRILEGLFGHQYSYYKDFFHEFLQEYMNRSKEPENEPPRPWLAALPKLEKIFK